MQVGSQAKHTAVVEKFAAFCMTRVGAVWLRKNGGTKKDRPARKGRAVDTGDGRQGGQEAGAVVAGAVFLSSSSMRLPRYSRARVAEAWLARAFLMTA